MTRWGEEESKTKGLVSLFVWLGIVGFIGFVLFINLDSITKRKNLEKAMQDIVRGSLGKQETELRAKIAEAAEELGIELHPGDIDLTVKLNTGGNYDVHCLVPYVFEVNLILTKTSFQLNIKEDVEIVAM